MKFPLLSKAVAIGGVMVVLVISLNLVRGIVAEREGRLREAEQSVAASLAGAQTVLGPVAQRACTERWQVIQGEGKDQKRINEQREFTLYAVPDRLALDGEAKTEIRHRGIFQVNGYVLTAALTAQWRDLAALRPKARHAGSTLECGDPQLWVGVSDPRGIRTATITLQGVSRTVQPATGSAAAPLGFHAAWPELLSLEGNGDGANARIELQLVGTQQLAFVPIAQGTDAKLTSDWPHPSFNGRFLPTQRDVSENGFQAQWQINSLASRAPQEIQEGLTLCAGSPYLQMAPPPPRESKGCLETFGVGLVHPVSTYVLSDRATKYGLLFIGLTFLAVAMVEVLRRLRVHPMQYLLVGSALVVFFLLLVSLSEHMTFAMAYLIAAGACTALLTYYGAHALHGQRAGLLFGGGVGALYGALYVLLLQEQRALVLGASLMFAVLAAVMVVTRRLDWYGLLDSMRKSRAESQVAGG